MKKDEGDQLLQSGSELAKERNVFDDMVPDDADVPDVGQQMDVFIGEEIEISSTNDEEATASSGNDESPKKPAKEPKKVGCFYMV